MKKVTRGLLLGILTPAFVLIGSGALADDKAKGPKPREVTVVNTPTVNVGNAPTVTVGNTATNPVLVRNVDQAAGPASTPVSAHQFCTQSDTSAKTLLIVDPTQTFTLTDYVVAGDFLAPVRVTITSGAHVTQLAVSTGPGQTASHTLGTPLVFRGFEGNMTVQCDSASPNGTSFVTVSGTLQ